MKEVKKESEIMIERESEGSQEGVRDNDRERVKEGKKGVRDNDRINRINTINRINRIQRTKTIKKT